MKDLKVKIHSTCLQLVEERIASIQKAMHEARQAANNETKSSAGDKYETGRAMMQLELEKSAVQLAEAERIKSALVNIVPHRQCETAVSGALISTDLGLFYMAAMPGKMQVDGYDIFAVSPEAPAGLAMKNRKAGDSFVLNGKSVLIKEIA